MGGMGGGGKGGGKGGGSVDAPDFNKVAQQQADISKQNVAAQTLANRANQTNAFGANSTWTQLPNGQWSQTGSLSGPLGQASQNLMGQVANQGALPTGQEARDQAITSAYSQAMSRLKPEWDKREEQTRSQLAAQGLDPGTEAATSTMDSFNRARNDAETSAMASAIGQGTEAGNAIFQQGVTSQSLPWQQLAALQGLSTQTAVPMAGQAQTPDMLGASGQQYQAALNSNAQQQSSKNSMMSGLGTLAGAGIGTMIAPGFGTMLGAQLGGAAGGALGGAM